MGKNKSQPHDKKGRSKQIDKKSPNKVWLKTRRRIRQNILER